jgi:hypothetical protein
MSALATDDEHGTLSVHAQMFSGTRDIATQNLPSHALESIFQDVQITNASVASQSTPYADNAPTNLGGPVSVKHLHIAIDNHKNVGSLVASETSPQDVLQSYVQASFVDGLPSSIQSTDNSRPNAVPHLNGMTPQATQTATSSPSATMTFTALPTASIVHTENSNVNEPLWYSSQTPKWNEAIKQWTENPSTKDQPLKLKELMKDAVQNSPVETVDFLSQLQPSGEPSTKWRLRLKRCEPILNAAKGILMPLANLDPQKVAPIICASVLFGMNVSIPCSQVLVTEMTRSFSTE